MQIRDYAPNWPRLRLLRFYSYGSLENAIRYRAAVAGAFPKTVGYQIGDSGIGDGNEWCCRTMTTTS